MNTLTLVYSGTEKFLADWGYGPPTLELVSRAPSKMTFPKVGGDPAAAADVPYLGQVTIYKDRVFGGGVFSGGAILFVGRRTDYGGIADPAARSTHMVISDPWWDLENIIFQHYWQAAMTLGSSTLTTVYFSKIYLFQDISAGPTSAYGYLPSDQQIAQIITFSATAGANIQLGACDPTWIQPVQQVKCISCAEAVLLCLRMVPDAATFFDYTTSPPTLHIRRRAWMIANTAVTLPYAGGDDPGATGANTRFHKSSRVRPLPNLQPSEVVLQYQKVNNFNGTPYNFFSVDAWPAMSNGLAIGALVAAIDLRGGTFKDISAQLTSVAIDVTNVSFWQLVHKDLSPADGSIGSLAIVDTTVNDGAHDHGIKVVDESGADVDPADYGYMLTDGSVAPWMYLNNIQADGAVTSKKVTVTGYLKYKKTIAGTTTRDYTGEGQISTARIVLTNSPSTAGYYLTVTTLDPGEPQPPADGDGKFLAQLIYESLQTLQWEGEHVIVENNIFQVITPGMVLNLSASPFTAINAVITRVTVDFFYGKTTIEFGPEKHLGPAQLVEKLMLWRWRFSLDNPNLRNAGYDT